MREIRNPSGIQGIRRAPRILLRFALAACVFCPLSPRAVAAEPSSEGLTAPDRRKDQFAKDFGYAAFPYPYRLPGIGSGLSTAIWIGYPWEL